MPTQIWSNVDNWMGYVARYNDWYYVVKVWSCILCFMFEIFVVSINCAWLRFISINQIKSGFRRNLTTAHRNMISLPPWIISKRLKCKLCNNNHLYENVLIPHSWFYDRRYNKIIENYLSTIFHVHIVYSKLQCQMQIL